MSRLGSGWILVVIISLMAGRAQAQDPVLVVLETNMPQALVFADSSRIGLAQRGTFIVPPGTRTLRLVPGAGGSWSIQPISIPFEAIPGDTVEVSMRFPYHYKIESIPFGATVRFDGEEQVLGETPMLYQSEAPLQRRLLVEEPGYVTEEIVPGQEIWNRYVLTLKPVAPSDQLSAEVDWSPPRKQRLWIDLSAAALAVGSGVLAVHYKFKADRRDDLYRETGDPALRDEINSLDRRSAVALGTMQVGVGVLALRFVLR